METFNSKVDSSYYAILCIYGIMSMSFCLFSKSIGSFLFVGLIFLFIITQIQSIKYRIDKTSKKLIILGGVFYKTSLDVNTIVSIVKDNSAAAAPAGSFEGIKINTGSRSIKISPKNQSAFLEKVKEINPNIIISI